MTFTSEYTLSYPTCLPPQPAFCQDTDQLTQRCTDGEFVTVDNSLISSDCDCTYDNTMCGPPEWEF